MDKEQIINEIKYFLEGGNDDIKYLVNVETNPDSNKATCVIHEPNKPHRIEEISYTSFLYTKDIKSTGYRLYNGDKKYTVAMMKKYGVTIKKMKTGNHPRLENGYPYKVTSTKSYNHLLDFFKKGGIDPFETIKDEDGRPIRDQNARVMYKFRELFYMPKLNEQFFISTGARLFKGIEEYKDLHRLTFDIETKGLRYEHTRIFAIGVRDNRGFEITLEASKENDDDAEIRLIQDFFNIVNYLKPAVIVGYNSEEFDFPFILGRAEILGMDLKNMQTTLSESSNIRKQNATVKFGNSTERYRQTVMWGYSVLDILHAVKRTVAVNTDIKNNKLKYICQYEGIAKPDRMYIDGKDGGIGSMWDENAVHIINTENNNYKRVPDSYQEFARQLLQLEKKRNEFTEEEQKFLRKEIYSKSGEFVQWLRNNIAELSNDLDSRSLIEFISGKDILRQYLLDDLWETEQVDNLYNQSSFLLAKIVPTTYARIATMGNAAVWNLLMTTWSYENDLAIPHPDEVERFSGGLTRCYKKGYTKRVVKIDFASLYPMLQLWLDIFPMFDITGVIKKMLTYMTTTRNIYKKLASSTPLEEDEVALMRTMDHDSYEKYQNDSFTKEERSLFKTKQLPIKILNNSLFGALGSGYAFNWSDNICAARITCSGRLELRHAINWFRSFGLDPLLAVTDGVNFGIPDTTTIKVTNEGISEGVNEGVIEEMWQYNGKAGVAALIEKFNVEEMQSEFMSVDNDGEFKACLNLSRINYALLTDKDKIKFTGNTIKSKTMPEYIEEFIDNGMKLILEGRGSEFVEYYHDYAERIFYKQIPLKKIASKSKIKNSIKDYVNRGVDKNGKLKARQAHMELVIAEREKEAREIFESRFEEIKQHAIDTILNESKANNKGEITKNAQKKVDDLNVKEKDSFSLSEIINMSETFMSPEPPLDSMVYYVNIGTRKSHGDVKTKKVTNDDGQEVQQVEINARLINSNDLEENPDITGEYNVDKYLDAFNKRVDVLLDGFEDEIREKILVKIKRTKVKDASGKKVENVELDKNLFTSDELVLKNFDHDHFDESMYLEDKEIEFWNKSGYDPKLIWGKFSTHEDELYPEIYEFALNFLSEKMVKAGKPKIKSVNDSLSKGDYVLIKNYKDYTLGYNNGHFVEVLKTNVHVPLSPIEIELEKKELEREDKIRKLEMADSEGVTEELKEKISEKEKLDQYFESFKVKYNVSPTFEMDSLFEQVPDAKLEFDKYVKEMEFKESPNAEYEVFDDGDL